jgi:hypothetical protein
MEIEGDDDRNPWRQLDAVGCRDASSSCP